ncbi:MAG: xanthine dehydrogenase family protein molybdopterin-binding subunit [Acidimicrobiaceae bacterium]|nr:xanthine dehydrogenase family protein molybdopterin-binding subunit [Acidimicrobiaceae bacterium]
MSVLGNRVLRTEDPRMLTEGARYVADLRLDGAVRACFVRSTVARGRLTGVDTAEAGRQPGVLGVFTAADLDLPDLKPIPMVDQRMTRPVLARDTVCFVGEPVAAVVAETAAAAADAAEHVLVDIDPQPAVVALPDAATGDTLVHPGAGTNVAFDMPAAGNAEAPVDFSDCEVTVEASLVNQRLAAVPLEPRSAAAEWSPDGTRLTFYASTQAPHRVRDALASLYGLDKAAVRVVTPDVGGGFGAKGTPAPEELAVAGLARAVGRPVVWTESRAENLTSSVHGRAQRQRLRLGGSRTGRITHYELEVAQDAGAYPMIGAFLPTYTRKVFTGCYRIANASISGQSLVTNTAPVTAYRGAGRPEAVYAIERAVDLYAATIGMDPAEARRLNFVAPEGFPYTNPAGSTYDTGDFGEALDRALAAARYDDLRAEQASRRAGGDPMLLGIGIASFVESTSMGPSELGEIELAADGSLVVRSGATAFGQGHDTCWAMIAAEATGVPLDRIKVISGDTAEIASSGLTAASRSAQLAGSAVLTAARHLVELARVQAAACLEAAEADIVLDTATGAFHVAGSPQPRVNWADITARATDAGEAPLAAVSDFEQPDNTYAFGCHVAVVEIDSRTGEATLRRLVACDDAGTLINPLVAEGQVQGGIAQGVAQVLLEEMVYDADGNPLATNLVDYPAISAPDLPSFDLVPMETPTPLNPLGAKGIGESGTVGAGPAVLNAVHDAVAHLGIDHIDMPATPQRIWHALRTAGSGRTG